MKPTLITILFITTLFACNVDKSQQAIQDIKAADIAFSDMSANKGIQAAFIEYVADSGVLLRPNSYPIVGKDNVIKRLGTSDDSNLKLVWQPLFADAAQSGELGYTYGKYTLTVMDSAYYGTYVSVWKKEKGEWKYVLDTGNEGLGDK